MSDMKRGKSAIEDFSVHVPSIPIDKEEYENNPDLLAAILAVHFEKIAADSDQCLEGLEDK